MKNQLADRAGRLSPLIVSLVALICSVMVSHAVVEIDPTEAVAMVNGEKVTFDEVQFFFGHHRSKVYQHFHKVHGVTDFAGFWKIGTSFGEESPLGMLKDMAMRDIIQTRIQLQLARDEGLLRDTSFQALMNLREQENLRREKALQSGRVIYGPREYSESVFFDYIITNLVIRLKEQLNEQEFEELVSRKASQAEVRILPAYDLIQVEW